MSVSRFDTATTAALHAIAEAGNAPVTLMGDQESFGSTHFGLGRITRSELSDHYGSQLAAAGVTPEDYPDGAFWIVHCDVTGLVYASSFHEESAYLRTLSTFSTGASAQRSAV